VAERCQTGSTLQEEADGELPGGYGFPSSMLPSRYRSALVTTLHSFLIADQLLAERSR
jgi:hypothetical protein